MFIASYICMGTVKNNHNYMVQIILFFKEMFKLCIVVLAYTFLKPHNSKIEFSHYTTTITIP